MSTAKKAVLLPSLIQHDIFIKTMIDIQNAVPRMPEFRFKSPVYWHLSKGQHWAVVGSNGAGKTLFCDILTGKIPLKEGSVTFGDACYPGAVRLIAFKNIYDMADYKSMYYQQRWNATEADQAPLVKDLIATWKEQDYLHELLHYFNALELLDKRLILLSSGELRKFLIIQTLLAKPAVLIIDNPYIGLDAPSRILLNDLLQRIAQRQGIQIILVLSNPDDIPDFITDVLPVSKMQLQTPVSPEAFRKQSLEALKPVSNAGQIPFPAIKDQQDNSYEYALKMDSINIQYGSRTILKNLSWEVKRGEAWALLGPNGSGKSTLLSLVCADNPQSYANTFYLFDRKRGSGESIWDIKKRIGYISPELHLFYLEDVPTIHIVGSGFFDSIGLYRKCNEEQQEKALHWMEIFGIAHLQSRSFLKLSYGEQRLALLARAFVKSPELLILDEPLHGLDKLNKIKASHIIEQYCRKPDKTLIYVTHYQEEIPACASRIKKLPK